jgi:hypothetical protein
MPNSAAAGASSLSSSAWTVTFKPLKAKKHKRH